jgi:hypothetical protein
MQQKIPSAILAAAAVLVTGLSAGAQTYSNAVMALNPAAYWPLTETAQPSGGLYVATNLGTLGVAGQGYYETWWQTNGVSNTLMSSNSITHIQGAIVGDPDTALVQGQVGQYVVIPRTTNGVANAGVTLTAPFSIEMWVYPTNTPASKLMPILAEGFTPNSIQATNVGYQATTEGTSIGMYGGVLYFNTFNGPTAGTKSEIDTATLALNQWYHIVATFDGTNMRLYLNGVLIGTKAPPNNVLGQNYVPDPISPLVVGGGSELGLSGGANTNFMGALDEVAIYHGVLSQTQVTTDYQTGTNVNRSTPYPQVIEGNSPAIYLRLDEPAFTGPSVTASPVANNYGSLGAAANGYYLPGTTPGLAGPSYAGFGPGNYSVALNGFNSGVDIGGGALPLALNPTNAQPITVAAWFKGNPADCVGRFQTIIGHSSSSWRLNLDQNAGVQFNPGNGPQLQFASVFDELNNGLFVNDGNWHFAAGVSDGTNDYLYIDGVLAKQGTAEGAVTNGSLQDVILGGDPQFMAPQPLPVGGGGQWFDGSLAQVAIYTNALTATQIQGVYAAAEVPPVIRTQPASQALNAGTVGSIPAVVIGSALSYQWYYQNGSPVSGQTASSLNFSPVTTGSAGSYYLVATNNYGAVTSAVAQVTVFQPGTYSYVVRQLNPVAYWPLNETNQPPSGQYIATNIGTLGAFANGYYQSYYLPVTLGATNTFVATNNIQHVPGATGDGDTALDCGNALGAGQYVVFPRVTNGVPNPAVTITAPFTIEAWVKTTNMASTLRPIVTEGRNSVQGGASHNYTNETYGFSLGQYSTYFYFQVYNANINGNNGVPELDVHNLASNVWYYVVVTYDGSVETIYTNGVEVTSASATYVPDPTSPLMIGSGTDVATDMGANEFSGAIDDVAIYSTALSQTQISTHYAAVGANYSTTVLGDSPSIYLRLDEPAFNSYPSPSTYPVATNYGTIGAAANGLYQPGTTPGVAGPTYPGFGSNSAVAFNGFYGGVDIGGGLTPFQLNPLGLQPQTVTAWFQANPADARFQEIASRGDSSWRLAFNGYNGNPSTAPFDVHFNPGNNPSDLGCTNISDVLANGAFVNDGNWHFAAGVSDGTNAYLYVDGALIKKTNVLTSLAGTTLDALIGGSPAHTTPSYNTGGTIRYFDGQVAQVAYFTNALSASQIQQIYGVAGVPLTIWQQPATSTTNNSGSAATITVVVHGSSPVYQWYSTNVNTGVVSPVTGQTNASLVFNPAALGNSGFYFAIATNAYSSVTSSVAQLTVVGPPIIVAQSPSPIQVFVGTAPTLQVTAQGPAPLIYQWTSNSIVINGATAPAYSPSTAAVGTSVYTCIVTNTLGAVTNSPISFAVITDPTAPFPAKVLADGPVAYYRLDETGGTTAYDYAGGNNATYTNVLLGQPGYDSEQAIQSDPTETAAGFGFFPPANDYAGNVPPYLNFGTPNGSNAEFSVEAWVTEYEYPIPPGGNAIVALGTGGGGEQFVLDTGNTSLGDLRFFVRNTAGTVSSAGSTNYLKNDGYWHHVVGVCDEAGGHVYLYLDGNQVASGTIAAGSGILSSTTPLSIGARQSGNNGGTNYDYQLYGSVDDVAIYNKALSAAQVQAHYIVSGVAPVITGLLPSSTWTTNQAANPTFTVTATGTAPLSYQWIDNNGNQIPWGTNATLTLTNVQPGQAGNYTVNVANLYGGPVSTNFTLTITQVPQIVSDITPQNVTVYATSPVTLSVTVSGTPPLSYQWYQDGTAIPGATNTTYTFAALLGSNTYYLSVTNIYSAGTPLVSSTATVVGMPATTLNPTNYTDNLKIVLSGYNRSETLHDFPALVQLSTSIPGFNYNHFASPTGADLRFTDSSGTRVIPSEIDQWDLNGVSTVWVQVPALSSTNTTIWAYWGNPSNTVPLPGTNVWVPQPWEGLPAYDVVYHLKENGFPFADSTGQNPALNGIAPTPVPGIIGTGESFAGSAFLDAGTNVNVGNYFTVSAWVNLAPTNSNIQGIWASKAGGNSSGFGFYVNFYDTTDQELVLETGNGNNNTPTLQSPGGAVSSNQWHLVAAAIDRADDIANLYVDGAVVVTGTSINNVRNDFGTNGDINLGQLLNGGFPFSGLIDEARIQSGTNSANWVWASWMTVAQNASFQSYSNVVSTVINPVAIQVQFSAGSLSLSGTGGTPSANYYVLGSTNLALPMAQWTVLSTNSFDGSGNFNISIPVSRTQEFFRILQ